MSCTDNFIGFKACGATESKSGLFIEQLGFTTFSAAHTANHEDVTGAEMYRRVHDEAMMLLEDYFFDRLSKFQNYKSYLGTELIGGFGSDSYMIENDTYTLHSTAYVDRRIGYIYIKPLEDGALIVNEEEVELIKGEVKRILIDSYQVTIEGSVQVAGCAGRGFQMEIISECNPHRFFCKFLRYLKKPALYLTYAKLLHEMLTTGRNNSMVTNMQAKNERKYVRYMGGEDPITGERIKGEFWTSLDNTIRRIGSQLEETECIECSAAKFITQIP